MIDAVRSYARMVTDLELPLPPDDPSDAGPESPFSALSNALRSVRSAWSFRTGVERSGSPCRWIQVSAPS
jgi:hypothetical protein